MSDSQTQTEDHILGNIPGIDDVNTDDGAGGAPGVGADSGTGGSVDNTGRSSAEPTGQQAGGDIVRRHDGLIERQSQEDPRTRDLVDPRTGRTVARGGIERHVYEEGQRHARENVSLRRQLELTQAHVANVSEVTRVANELQVSPENQVTAIRVMSDFLRDPVRTLQALTEEVKAKGYQIPFLTEGVSPGMDLAAISRMIDAKMAPITQAQQSQQQQEARVARATQELDGFLNRYPEANANLDILAQMMQSQQGLTLHDAYVQMMRWAYNNGIDYTQPLRPQVDAINQQRQQQPNGQQQPNRAPLPGARSVSPASSATPMNDARAFNENTAWGDIIRHSMQESGMTF